MTSMTFEEVRACLKQRFPLIMVDRVLEVESGKRIKAVKNVTGNEIQFLGHFPGARGHAGNFHHRSHRPMRFHSL